MDVTNGTHQIKKNLAVIGILFVILYAQTFRDLIQIWASNEDYGHGFLVLPITVYLIWRKKDQLACIPLGQTWWGVFLLACWAALFFIGVVGSISTITYISMILFLIGAVVYLMGIRVVCILLFPIFFLIFLFPIPSEIYTRSTNPLMLLSSAASFHILDALNLPVLRDGNIITLPNYTMEVVMACSGIRSLVSTLALALLTGYLMLSSNFSRGLLVILSVPIALVGNAFRIVATALMAFYISPQLAEGFSHTMAGLLTFILVVLLLIGCLEIIEWFGKKREFLH